MLGAKRVIHICTHSQRKATQKKKNKNVGHQKYVIELKLMKNEKMKKKTANKKKNLITNKNIFYYIFGKISTMEE
jgi:acyl CoA:acetate/3-ketoacid CoA transferase beta subunit